MSGSNGILVTPSDPPTQRDILQIVGRDLGQDDWGSAIHHVSFDSDTEFSHIIKNLGTGGTLQLLTSSGANAGYFDDTGLVVSGFLATGDFGVLGNTSLGNAPSDTLTVAATSTFNAPVTINASLHVTGAGLFDGTLGAGATTLSSLHVTGAALVGSTLTVSAGGASITGGLTVSTGNLAVSAGILGVSGAGTFGGLLTVSAGGAAITGGLTVATGNFALTSGIANIGGKLTVLSGGADITGGLTISTGNLVISDTASKIIPGATSLALRNNADSANNLLVTDAGAATVRNGLTVTAGGATVTAGNLAVSSGTITGSSTVQGTQLISTVAIGTAPLTVTSTTVVPNLNANFLQGHPASDFLTGLTGAVLTDSSTQTKLGALTVNGDLTAGTRLLVGGTPLLLADAPNSRVIVGSGTALGSASNDRLSVVGGTLHVATPSTTAALSLRYSTTGTGFNIGPSAAANPDLIFHDGVGERFRVGNSASTYQALVTGDTHLTGRLDIGTTPATTGELRVPKSFHITARDAGNANDLNIALIDGSDNMQFGDTSHGGSTYLASTSTAYLYAGGFQIQADANGLGLFTSSSIRGGGNGVLYIANRTTAPTSNPTGGGLLYAEAGSLKWRGSGGTVTTIAAA